MAWRAAGLFLCVLLWPLQSGAGVDPVDAKGLERLRSLLGSDSSVSLNRATGTVSFVRLQLGESDFGADPAKSRQQLAMVFLNRHRLAFGLADPVRELVLVDETTDRFGHSHLRYRQQYAGVPVFGSDLRVHFDQNGRMSAVGGVTIPVGSLDPHPTVSGRNAEEIALRAVATGLAPPRSPVDPVVRARDLVVFRTGLVQGIEGRDHLAYRVEVVDELRSLREWVFVDAHNRKVLDRISGIHHALDRRVYAGGIEPEYLVWQEGDGLPYVGDDADGVNTLIEAAEHAYNFFLTMSGGTYPSFDAADAVMHSVFDDPALFCFLAPNAAWNGQWTGFCDGTTADDVVAHEWAHAYSESTHDLIYQWQPGALNESFSDVFGEAIDLLNGVGSDAPSGGRTADGSECSLYGLGSPANDDSLRWLVGEDASAFGGAIRDMWRPECYDNPGKVSSGDYHCSTDDGGGVHTNSGVPNHTFALLVDGGTFNGQTVAGIGLTRALQIYWYAMTDYQGPATDFAAHADALEAACSVLVGADLPAPDPGTTTPSSSGLTISAAHCTELGKAIAATELRDEPEQCGFQPLLESDTPALCAGLGSKQSLLLSDWESGLGSWSVGTRAEVNPATFDTPDWAVVGSLPDGRPGMAAFVENISGGDCDTDVEAGVLYLESPPIDLPGEALVPRIAFDHWVATEALYDGGNLKISVNGGPFDLVPAAAFDYSPYNANLEILTPLLEVSDNPLAGEAAFTGSDGGQVTGSWGSSHVNLFGLAAAGDTVKFRFEFGIDGCGGLIGWFVDDVEVYGCSDELPPSDCGNGGLDPGEACDDGNAVNQDGCSNTCQIEPGWSCTSPTASAPVGDHSFEAGYPNPSWDGSSIQLGQAPICSEATCFVDAAYDGDWYAWFGGSIFPEEAWLRQDLTIPVENGTLRFHLFAEICGTPQDYLEVLIDDQQVWSIDGNSPVCGQPGRFVEADVSSFADGQEHTLELHCETIGVGTFSNFYVDVVELPGTPSVCENTAMIFADGFESGDASGWSAPAP